MLLKVTSLQSYVLVSYLGSSDKIRVEDFSYFLAQGSIRYLYEEAVGKKDTIDQY